MGNANTATLKTPKDEFDEAYSKLQHELDLVDANRKPSVEEDGELKDEHNLGSATAKEGLGKKLEDVKKSAEEFAKEKGLDVKAKEAKEKAVDFAKEKGLDVKAKEAKEKAVEFAKKNELDKKYEQVREYLKRAFQPTEKTNDDKGIASDTKEIKEKEISAEKEGYPGDVTYEAIVKEIDIIANKIVDETQNLIEKEEVQKVLAFLMAKLAELKSKFDAMTQRKNEKGYKEYEEGVEVELGKENEAKVVVVEKAFYDAETKLVEVAERFGIVEANAVAESEEVNNEEITTKDPIHMSMEVLKKNIDVITHKIEAETKNIKEKDEVQKILTAMMTKLSIAKSKFIAMTHPEKATEGDNKKDLGHEVEPGKESQVKEAVEENKDSIPNQSGGVDNKAKDDKESRRLKITEAVQKALENAEDAIKKTADRFGIKGFDRDEEASKTDKNDKEVV